MWIVNIMTDTLLKLWIWLSFFENVFLFYQKTNLVRLIFKTQASLFTYPQFYQAFCRVWCLLCKLHSLAIIGGFWWFYFFTFHIQILALPSIWFFPRYFKPNFPLLYQSQICLFTYKASKFVVFWYLERFFDALNYEKIKEYI